MFFYLSTQQGGYVRATNLYYYYVQSNLGFMSLYERNLFWKLFH